MRWILRIFVALVVIWSGYWLAGKLVIERQAAAFFAGQEAEGRVARTSALWVQGWPNRWDLTLEGIDFADPARGIGYSAKVARVLAMTWKPWHLRLALADQQVVTLPDQVVTISGTQMGASLRTEPSLALPLAEAGLSGTGVAVTSSAGWAMGLGDVLAVTRRTNDPAPAYAIWVEATGLTPGALLALPPDLPERIDAAVLDATLTLSAPIDRAAGDTRPRPVALDLRALELRWGELRLQASGSLAADDQGFAAGRVQAVVTNWVHLPPLLVAAGALPARMAGTLGNMLGAVSKPGDAGPEVTLPLVLEGGQIRFGPLVLGAAPRLLPPPA